MQAFFSWLTSQSGVSLSVALVALIGVLVTTWWNNKAADKRRRADQVAADQRRKDDQAAEDARRKADDDRRERERQEIRWREDLARQRGAVTKCFRAIKNAETHFQNVVTGKAYDAPLKVATDSFEQRVLETHKATSFADFFHACMLAAEELELELTQPKVRAWAIRLRKKIETEYNEFDKEKQRGFDAWINWSNTHVALSVDVKVCLNGLLTSAFEHLHPYPTPDGAVLLYSDGSAGMSVNPKATRPGTRDNLDAQANKEDNDN